MAVELLNPEVSGPFSVALLEGREEVFVYVRVYVCVCACIGVCVWVCVVCMRCSDVVILCVFRFFVFFFLSPSFC